MLFAHETQFWLLLITSWNFCDELQMLYGYECIAEPNEFWPAIILENDK